MNYFELFDLPISFQPDQSFLKTRFDEAKASAREPADINKAYEVLSDEDATIKYILQLKGILQPGEVYDMEPQFELEVMDINEELMELELDENQEQLMNVEQKTNRLLLKIYEDITPVLENYATDPSSEEALLQVKDFYFQKKYLESILDRIRGIRNIASPL